MAEQRQRASSKPTPERNLIRGQLAEFEETDNQFVLISPLNAIEGTSVSLPDATVNTYWHMANDVGITTRIAADDTQISRLRSAYSFTPTSTHERQWFLDVHDIGSPYGTDVGRTAFVQVYNSKIAGSESSASAFNRSMVLMRAKVAAAASNEAVVFVEATNTDTNFQVQGTTKINLLATAGGKIQFSGDMQILGQPYATTAAGEHSHHSAGTDENRMATNAADITISTTAGTYTDVVSVSGLSCRLGRLYRVTFLGGHNLLVQGSGFATSDQWDMRIQRDTGGGYTSIETWRMARGVLGATGRYPIPNRSVLFSPSATGNVSFRAQVTKATGASTVTSTLETNSNEANFRIVVEDIGWTSGALN